MSSGKAKSLVRRAAAKVGVMLICAICKEPGNIRPAKECKKLEDFGVRLVRDHNHYSKMVRGILCEQCNTRLGWLERLNVPKGRTLTWFVKYHEAIFEHLTKRTPVRFTGSVDKKMLEELFGQKQCP